MWRYNHTDELYHFGIPGMHWRHRKAQINKKKNKKSNHILRKTINSTIKTVASIGMGGYNNETISNAKKTAKHVTLAQNMSPKYKSKFIYK